MNRVQGFVEARLTPIRLVLVRDQFDWRMDVLGADDEQFLCTPLTNRPDDIFRLIGVLLRAGYKLETYYGLTDEMVLTLD